MFLIVVKTYVRVLELKLPYVHKTVHNIVKYFGLINVCNGLSPTFHVTRYDSNGDTWEAIQVFG